MASATALPNPSAVMPAGGFGNYDPRMFIREGRGSRVWDEDGNEYIDYLIGSGPMLLGHGNAEVLEAVAGQIGKGMTFFANNSAGIELAEEICRAVACVEQVRFPTDRAHRNGEHDQHRHDCRSDYHRSFLRIRMNTMTAAAPTPAINTKRRTTAAGLAPSSFFSGIVVVDVDVDVDVVVSSSMN